MNCQEFEQIVNDLAKPWPLGATSREQDLTHALTCPDCELRLANARALIVGLKVLATTTDNCEASTQTEALLLAAFRQQKVTTASPVKSNVPKLPVKKSWQSPFPLWAYAAAAAVLIAVGGFAASMWLKTSPSPEIAVTPSPSPQIEVKQQDAIRPELVSLPQNQRRAFQTKSRSQPNSTDDGSYVEASLSEFTPLTGEEIATDFLSLTHETDSQPMESGQVIRVQMPRTALASFGLPVNIERANETIKADLLLAEDGSARAIRFIR